MALDYYHAAECPCFITLRDNFEEEGDAGWNAKKTDQLLCLAKIIVRAFHRKDLENTDKQNEKEDDRYRSMYD